LPKLAGAPGASSLAPKTPQSPSISAHVTEPVVEDDPPVVDPDVSVVPVVPDEDVAVEDVAETTDVLDFDPSPVVGAEPAVSKESSVEPWGSSTDAPQPNARKHPTHSTRRTASSYRGRPP